MEDQQDDLMDFKEQKLKEINRTPTPINISIGHNDNKDSNVQPIKDYLKNDNQFESVPEEIEAENREESDLENSIKSLACMNNQKSAECTDKSQEDDEDTQFDC